MASKFVRFGNIVINRDHIIRIGQAPIWLRPQKYRVSLTLRDDSIAWSVHDLTKDEAEELVKEVTGETFLKIETT